MRAPPGQCACGGASEVVDGAHVLLAGEAPPAKHRRQGDLEMCQRLPLPYWLRSRRCLECGTSWPTVELRLNDLNVHLFLIGAERQDPGENA